MERRSWRRAFRIRSGDHADRAGTDAELGSHVGAYNAEVIPTCRWKRRAEPPFRAVPRGIHLAGHHFPLHSFSTTRAFTIFLTSATGSGLSCGKRMMVSPVSYRSNSSRNASISGRLMVAKVQCVVNAAKPTRRPLYL